MTNKSKHILIILFSFIVSLSYGQKFSFGYKIDNDQKKITIPFENQNNLIILPVVLNGKIPLRFILDTGVQHAILLDKDFSDILEITYDREIHLIGTGGHRGVKAYVANNVSLEFPGFTGKGLQLLVMEDNFIQVDDLMDIDVHGIVGYDIFNRFVVKIDYDRSQITLYEPSEFKPRRSYTEIPLANNK